MLDDNHRGFAAGEFGAQFQRGIGIVVIVVAQRLALQLLGLRDAPGMRADRRVERRLLVRVLAIAQLYRGLAVDCEEVGKELPLVGESEPLADHRIIGSGGREGLRRALAAEIERGRARCFEFAQ